MKDNIAASRFELLVDVARMFLTEKGKTKRMKHNMDEEVVAFDYIKQGFYVISIH